MLLSEYRVANTQPSRWGLNVFMVLCLLVFSGSPRVAESQYKISRQTETRISAGCQKKKRTFLLLSFFKAAERTNGVSQSYSMALFLFDNRVAVKVGESIADEKPITIKRIVYTPRISVDHTTYTCG